LRLKKITKPKKFKTEITTFRVFVLLNVSVLIAVM